MAHHCLIAFASFAAPVRLQRASAYTATQERRGWYQGARRIPIRQTCGMPVAGKGTHPAALTSQSAACTDSALFATCALVLRSKVSSHGHPAQRSGGTAPICARALPALRPLSTPAPPCTPACSAPGSRRALLPLLILVLLSVACAGPRPRRARPGCSASGTGYCGRVLRRRSEPARPPRLLLGAAARRGRGCAPGRVPAGGPQAVRDHHCPLQHAHRRQHTAKGVHAVRKTVPSWMQCIWAFTAPLTLRQPSLTHTSCISATHKAGALGYHITGMCPSGHTEARPWAQQAHLHVQRQLEAIMQTRRPS